jgi:hypothetical protein
LGTARRMSEFGPEVKIASLILLSPVLVKTSREQSIKRLHRGAECSGPTIRVRFRWGTARHSSTSSAYFAMAGAWTRGAAAAGGTTKFLMHDDGHLPAQAGRPLGVA